ncbi:hypothetical protein N8T08_004126 [Aspergillus melleus]|uniref:Uncharacterized protein n=1 Tax=Aspergillus melleus TaxID=138277 RepID=A0ACC3B5B9_9EURO|nr:hypothetical protein N8T08_004126 [Aspergillus melleus]
MRAARFSFLVYSLSLLAVVAGQSTAVTNGNVGGGNAITSGNAAPTTTEEAATTSVPSAETTVAEKTSSTEDTKPTEAATSSTTSEEPAKETTSSTTEAPVAKTSAENTQQTTAPKTTKADQTTEAAPKTTAADATSTGTTTSESSATPVVKTITTMRTVSGTPIETTMTTTSADKNVAADSTESPGLNGSSEDSKSSGLSKGQKNIIIGVVVGVGGAILIGALGVVAWRIRARKQNARDNDEAADLMSGTAVGAGAREKAPSPGAGGTPFKSTLDQYHNPGPVNAASNF